MRIPKEALIAQLDRVQVSEACGVGSSPAERTNFKNINSKIEKLFISFLYPFGLFFVFHKFALIQLEFYLIDVYKC